MLSRYARFATLRATAQRRGRYHAFAATYSMIKILAARQTELAIAKSAAVHLIGTGGDNHGRDNNRVDEF